MLAMTGIWLLVALTDGSQVGLKAMPNMAECQRQAATYRTQPAQYTRVECVGDPIIGSPRTFINQTNPSDVVDIFARLLRGVGQ